MLARRLILGGASSPMTAADPWLSAHGRTVVAGRRPWCWAPATGPVWALLAYRI